MIRNYFLVLWRSISRKPLYSILNVSSLGIGMATALIILLYMQFELTFDQHNRRAEDLYRVETTRIHTAERVMDVNWRTTPGNLAPLIQQDYPEVKKIGRTFGFFQSERILLEAGEKKIQTDQIYAVDSTISEIFSFDWLYRQSGNALSSPNSIALSERLAKQLFGTSNPVGQIISSRTPARNIPAGPLQLMITGVYKDWPENSHWFPNALVSSSTDPGLGDAYFNAFSFNTYILLQEDVQPDSFAKKLSSIYIRYLDPQREPVMKKATHRLLPLLQIHFDETEGQNYLYTFGAIGLLLLLIALISYVNLAIAQSSKRAKEVALRKVLGSQKQQLILQFLGESFLFTFFGLLLGILLANFGVAIINDWLSLVLDAGDLWQPVILLSMLILLIGLTVLGGAYPALYLSSFQAVDIIRGKGVSGKHRIPIRKLLVGLQFVVVLFVLVCTAMISTQLAYMQEKDLGFEQERMVAFELPQSHHSSRISMIDQFNRSPHIAAFCQTSFVPGGGNMIRGPISVETPEGPQQDFVRRGYVDERYLTTMDIRLVDGRAFSPAFSTDSAQGAIVNQTFIRHFDLTDVIGTKVRLGGQGNPNFLRIVGVVEDYHESSLHNPIQPQLYLYTGQRMSIFVMQLLGNLAQAEQEVEQIWQEHFPETPFNLYVLNELLQEEYESDQIRSNIFKGFSLITICLAFLGLFGLASFLAKQRTKEIGIRKVLGASNPDLLVLMTKPFLYLLLLAALPAFGLGWWFIHTWLENFAFRAEIRPGLFVLVWSCIAILILAVTGWHAIRSAQLNPVDALRDE